MSILVRLALRLALLSAAAVATVAAGGTARAFQLSSPPEGGVSAGLKQFPTISRTHVAFVYANDLWCAPREGGLAVPLTDAPGMKANALFSPDGRTVAFAGNLEGNQEIYTVPTRGGTPTRVTYLPTGEGLAQWTPDGRLLFYTNSLSFNSLAMQLFTVPAAGGLPVRLRVPYGGDAALSPDGEWLAYTPDWPVSLMEHWKHYRGGMARDIWLFNLRTSESRKITDWEGTDTKPMWRGRVLYYVSDAGPENRLNLWQYDTKSGARKQLTRFAEYDVRNPSVGPGREGQGEIVFQYGAGLRLLDLGTGETSPLEVEIPEEHRAVRPADIDAGKFVTGGGLSPAGDRVLLNARGDIWVLPTGEGRPRNLTGTSGAFERDPSWSPDGKWVAYFSDATGEYELYVMSPDGPADARRLTHSGAGFKYGPVWSPDSARIAFVDQTNTVFVHTVAGGETLRVDADEWGSQPRVRWSPDSSWLVYNKTGENQHRSLWLYHAGTRAARQLTSGMFDDNFPSFDPAGDYLFFVSTRNYAAPAFSSNTRNFIYPNEDALMAVPLRRTTPSPLSAGRQGERRPASEVLIDVEGFEARAVRLPVEGWSVEGLEVTGEGNPVYLHLKLGGRRSLNVFDLSGGKERTVAEGPNGFALSADGRRSLIFAGGSLSVADTSAAQTAAPKPVSLEGMKVSIDRRAEWRQIFADAWRLYRDFFYDPNMHRIDWPAVRRRYAPMLDACMTREDVNFVLSEMAGELSVGHAYGGGGDLEQPPRVPIGMLGADFELHDGAYRFARIYEGPAWDAAGRGPLGRPGAGAGVKQGDYLLAVNGKPVDTSKDPRAAFVGLAGADATITVGERPSIDSGARQVVVKPLPADVGLRYSAWVEANRAYVARKSGGRVGYVHLPDITTQALNALVTQFYGQTDREALIIDIRWSQGGSLGDVFAKLLDPRVLNYLGGRYERDRPVPQRAHRGPKCLLVSGMSVSAGENFAYYFRKLGLGKLIGNRTWGGLVGLNGNPALIDGGYFNVPNAPFYEDDGTWMIEGHGIEPDIEVVNDPSKLAAGVEPQLDAAVAQMMNELKARPFVKPRKPTTSRDRRGGPIEPSEK